MPPRRRTWFWRLAIVLARATVLAATTLPHRPLTGDEPMFASIARSLLAGQGFTYNGAPWVSRSPGWCVVLAGIERLFGTSVQAGVFVQGLFDAGSILLAAWVARRIFASERAGWIAFVLMALWPPFLRESRFLQTEPMFTFAVVLVSAVALRFVESPTRWRAVATGLAGAFAALVRPNGAITPAALLLGALLFSGHGRISARRHALVALVFVLALAPWTIRNAIVFHAFIPVSSGAGELFYMGTAPETSGRWDHVKWVGLRKRVMAAEAQRLGRKPGALEQDRALMKAGLDELRRDPLLQFRFWLLRVGRLVAVPMSDNRTLLRAGFLAAIVLVDLLAVRGALRGAGSAAALAPAMLLTVLLNALALSVFYTNSRYFEPIRAMLLMLAAGALGPRTRADAMAEPAARSGPAVAGGA